MGLKAGSQFRLLEYERKLVVMNLRSRLSEIRDGAALNMETDDRGEGNLERSKDAPDADADAW